MEYIKTSIEGVFILEPKVFNDARGYFFESWRKKDFEEHIGQVDFIQDNKLVRVIKGRVLDVAADLRKSSPTFGRYVAVELSDANKRQLFIPRGFAHGFLVLSEEAVFAYKVDNVYAPQAEDCIRWDDKDIAVDWPIDPKEVITSEKDLNAHTLRNAEVFE